MRLKSIITVDHFYQDPLARRKEALSCSYRKDGPYPGMNSVRQFHIEKTMRKISAVLGRQIRWGEFPGNGCYRISMAHDTFEQDIHPDSLGTTKPFPQWAGTCYLSLPQDCHGGTSFWRHKKTGFERYPDLKEQAAISRIAKIPNTPKAIYRYFVREGLDRSRWKEVKRVPMKFNRLLLFKTDLFHSHTSLFGNRPENARLVRVVSFNEVDYFIKMIQTSKTGRIS